MEDAVIWVSIAAGILFLGLITTLVICQIRVSTNNKKLIEYERIYNEDGKGKKIIDNENKVKGYTENKAGKF